MGKLSVGVDAIVSQSRECILMILQSKQLVQLYAPQASKFQSVCLKASLHSHLNILVSLTLIWKKVT